jgi:hypothetical protein
MARTVVDRAFGLATADTVYVADGEAGDIVDCHVGTNDIVYFDVGMDTVTNCEVQNTPP